MVDVNLVVFIPLLKYTYTFFEEPVYAKAEKDNNL